MQSLFLSAKNSRVLLSFCVASKHFRSGKVLSSCICYFSKQLGSSDLSSLVLCLLSFSS
ncbi:hypothetical protein SLEP1_g41804 [Rubroshorea leprosula]|uniref:Uncharacterized protein n=1 Tax=Rubroshorea leprosula TaxID=152421 RepID=A0AAV5L7S9_9ROSI|nr:hypothetical protein SLEP1_g41804 [Rubroshorea leprosula]